MMKGGFFSNDMIRKRFLINYFPLAREIDGQKKLSFLKMGNGFFCIAEAEVCSGIEKTHYNLVANCELSSQFNNHYVLKTPDDFIAFSTYKEGKGLITSIYDDKNHLNSLEEVPFPCLEIISVMEGMVVKGKVITGKVITGKVVKGKVVKGKVITGKVVTGKVVTGKSPIPIFHSYRSCKC